jgi:hypothetical protein
LKKRAKKRRRRGESGEGGGTNRFRFNGLCTNGLSFTACERPDRPEGLLVGGSPQLAKSLVHDYQLLFIHAILSRNQPVGAEGASPPTVGPKFLVLGFD